jgi:transglutaminase-like putative cysteine protease
MLNLLGELWFAAAPSCGRAAVGRGSSACPARTCISTASARRVRPQDGPPDLTAATAAAADAAAREAAAILGIAGW